MSLVELNQYFTIGEYYCLLSVAIDADELDRYYWWINSQQDPKKFKWSSPTKGGTENAGVLDKLFIMAQKFGGSKAATNVKGNPLEFAKHTGRPIVYMDNDRQFYKDESKTEPIAFDFRARENRHYVVIPIK
jgi:hypothetical protein